MKTIILGIAMALLAACANDTAPKPTGPDKIDECTQGSEPCR